MRQSEYRILAKIRNRVSLKESIFITLFHSTVPICFALRYLVVPVGFELFHDLAADVPF